MAQKDDVVVTVRGKPKALIRKFSEEDIEDYVLGQVIESRLREHPEEYEAGSGLPLEDLVRKARRELKKRVRR